MSTEWRLKRNLLGISYTFASLHLKGDARNITEETDVIKKSAFLNHNNHILQVYDDLSFGKSTISVLYNFYYRQNKTDNTYAIGHDIAQHDYQKYVINNLKVDGVTKTSDTWTVQYGVSGSLLDLKSDYAYMEQSKRANFKEKGLDLYATTSLDFNKINMTAGIKYDITDQNYVGSKKVYHNIIPSISIMWQDDWGQIFGSYSKEVGKMPYTNLSVSPIYFSTKSIIVGNPSLRPEILHNCNVGFSKGNLNVDFFYKKYYNSCMMYSINTNDGIVNSYMNLKSEDQLGVNFSFVKSVSPLLLAKITWESYWDKTRLDDIETQESWNNFISTNVLIKFDKKGKLDMNMNYWALMPQKEHGVYWKNRGNFTLDIDYNIIKNKLRVTLKLSDVFNQDIARFSRSYNDGNTNQRNFFDNRKVSLTIRYMMSNKFSAKRNRQKRITGTERIPTE